MWSQNLDHATIRKLKQMIERRYGKGLEIRQLMDVSDESLLNQPYQRGNRLLIPIRYMSHYLGTAIIEDSTDLIESEKEALADTVRMILEPTMYKWYLQRHEENSKLGLLLHHETPIYASSKMDGKLGSVDLEILNSWEDDLTQETKSQENWNLDPLVQARPFDFIKSDHLCETNASTESHEEESEKIFDHSHLATNYVHLSGSKPEHARRVAFQVHEIAERWAFLSFSEIQNSIESLEDLKRLGALTLFVDELTDLSSKHQNIIKSMLDLGLNKNHPLVISYSHFKNEELRQQENIQPKFFADLLVNTFEIDRAPSHGPRLRQALSLFLNIDSAL